MANEKRPADASAVLDRHRNWLSHLERIRAKAETQKNAVLRALEKAADKAAADLLAEIPVEELNREKQGIRVKALRESGFATVADVASAGIAALAAVNGISSEGAAQVKQLAEEIRRTVRKEVRIRLSADDRNRAAADLVSAVYLFRRIRPDSLEAEGLLKAAGEDILSAAAAAKPASGALRWMFASRAAKADALCAYRYLCELLQGEYGSRCEALRKRRIPQSVPRPDTAWNDFTKDPIGYYTLLEELAPELFAGRDEVYGLPGELAARIRGEELHLEGLRCSLRQYQQWGVRYILHQKRVLLGDEMGLGKTVQAIAAMVSLHNTGETHFLVICPASVITNWCREIRKHSPLDVIRIHGDDRTEALERWIRAGGVGVTTFETTGHIAPGEDFCASMVIVDEAHYIKNPEAQRTVHTKRLCGNARRLLFMTGTALENRVGEMLELIRILRPEVAQQVQGITYLSTAPQFREKIAPVYYRRRREDVLSELPDLIENMDWCTMGPAEEQLYEQAVLEQKFADARRVSWNAARLEDSSKAMRLREIVEDAEEDGRKIIVFSFFLNTIRKVTEYFGVRCMEPISGSVPPEKRQAILDAFEKAPAGTILPAQIQSGGTGLNIQAASVVVICEPQFKPSVENQAISRAYRMGQARNVLVHRLLCEDTVDERICRILEQKQALFDAFADTSAMAEEPLELDMDGFGKILEEEAARIKGKHHEGVAGKTALQA